MPPQPLFSAMHPQALTCPPLAPATRAQAAYWHLAPLANGPPLFAVAGVASYSLSTVPNLPGAPVLGCHWPTAGTWHRPLGAMDAATAQRCAVVAYWPAVPTAARALGFVPACPLARKWAARNPQA